MGARDEKGSECKFYINDSLCFALLSSLLLLFDSCSLLAMQRVSRGQLFGSWSGLRDNRIRQMQERFHMRFFTVASNYDKCSQF